VKNSGQRNAHGRKHATSGALWLCAALAVVALTGAGCGSGSSDTTTTTAAAGTGSGTSASAHDTAVKFAECMRANGVGGFPDPDAAGKLTIDEVANGSSLDTSSAAFKQAISACKDLEPPGFTGRKATAQEQDARLQFARCVRRNGVKDFPDPARDAPLVDTNRIPSSATPAGMRSLNAAMRKCGSYAAMAGVRAGQ
jgi:hypothetical protein